MSYVQSRKVFIAEKEYDEFMKNYDKGAFGNKKLGLAFYDHFRLNRISDQETLQDIASKTGKDAIRTIESFVALHD